MGFRNPNGIARMWFEEIIDRMGEEEEKSIDLQEKPPMSTTIRIGEIVTALQTDKSKKGIVVGFDSYKEIAKEAPSLTFVTNSCCVAYPFEEDLVTIHELLLQPRGLATVEQLLTFPHVEARDLALYHPELIGYTRT